ncbi:Leishmanolysin [Phytophthora infestans]|uniref:Leishmanolysin n=1 Tax=Phytophthora infestans TaxID=4787 RepID=A0A8S9U3E0_PHYIN|nr:Leishmanolysin [Phytophthora infestans]
MSPAGTGVPNTDFLIYVRAESTASCQSGSTLAYASTCQKDQYDRPTFGMVNFCPNKLSTAAADFERQVSTALHEFSHALGFSSRFFPFMRNEDGTPRTSRDANGNPPTYTSGTCPNGRNIDFYVEPSKTIIKYSTERNHVVAKMVTPRVRAFVRDHFNCSTLEGAEIESQDGGCIGSHWEERLFEPEFMTPVDSYHNVFSALTLAFFADSGWYRVNASTSEIMHFGRKKGCSFATDKCVDPATEIPIADDFCTLTTAQGCSADARSRSACSLSSTSQSIPAEYQYFTGSPSKGGLNTFADFCPMNVGYRAGDCSISSNLLKLGSTSVNAYGETYCPTCKCTSTSLRSGDSTGWGINPPRQSGCYAMRCIATIDTSSKRTSTVVELTVPRSKTNDVISVYCTRKGDKLSVSGFSGDITCPDPLVVCEYDDPSRVLLTDIDSSGGSTSAPVSNTSTQTSTSSSSQGGSRAPVSSGGSRDSGNKAPASADASKNSQSYSDDGSGSVSNSRGNSRPGSGSTSKAGSNSITTGKIVSGVAVHQWASLWMLLGSCLAAAIAL